MPGTSVMLVLPLRVSARPSPCLETRATPQVSWTDTKYVWPIVPWKLICPLLGRALLLMLTPGPDTEYTPPQLLGISAPVTRRSFSWTAGPELGPLLLSLPQACSSASATSTSAMAVQDRRRLQIVPAFSMMALSVLPRPC